MTNMFETVKSEVESHNQWERANGGTVDMFNQPKQVGDAVFVVYDGLVSSCYVEAENGITVYHDYCEEQDLSRIEGLWYSTVAEDFASLRSQIEENA